MEDFDRVNKEIQDFLSARQSCPQVENKKVHKEETDIKYVLESLLHTYNEINTHLKGSNFQGVKDAILKNDIKMNLVNESLLKTLNKSVTDKNNLIDENEKLNRRKLELEQELSKTKLYSKKLETDVEYRSSNIAEMNRVMQDQKQKLSNEQSEAQRLKSEVNVYKVKLEELETLRRRANERFSNYEKEMTALTNMASEREEKYNLVLKEKREEENKNSGIKIKITEFERKIEVLERKVEMKEKNLNLCNEELSKLLVENKRFNSENEKFRNNAVYYEGLYKNLNEQNSYLNSQLNKIIQSDKYNKEGTDLIEEFNRKISRIKKKAKKYKIKIKELAEENADLKEKVEEDLYRVNSCDDTIILHTKIEELGKINREFKNQIKKLEEEKTAAEERAKAAAVSARRVEKKENLGFNSRMINKLTFSVNKDYKPVFEYKSHPLKFRNQPNLIKTPHKKEMSPVYRPIDLENEYKLNECYPGGFLDINKIDHSDEIEKSFYEHAVKLDHDYNTDEEQVKGKFTDVEKSRITEKLAKLGKIANKVKQNENIYAKETNSLFDQESNDSIKSVHTSSTLKEMMARTEMLRKKFENLENELGEIKEEKTDDRLVEQMKMYNNYYSDINVDNDSDIL
ncbi:hypothetical protein NUSPORA_01683 [Nucleospora cyclopteri]